MRVLFVQWGWPSHHYPMVPLGWALRAAGHEVRVAGQPRLVRSILGTGLAAVEVGRDVDAIRYVRGYLPAAPRTGDPPTAPPERRPARPPAAGAPDAGPPGARAADGPPGQRGPRVLGLFTALAEAMIPDLVRFARRWRPDLVVYEPTAWAGPAAAAAIGVPAVRHLYGPDILYGARDAVTESFRRVAARHGITAAGVLDAPVIDPCPPGLQVTGTRYLRQPVRYIPYHGPEVVSREPGARSPRPRICVTWGTTMGALGRQFFLAGDVARALAALDAEIVLAVVPAQRDLVGELPAGVAVTDSAPLHLVLRGCDAVVAQGGAGCLMTALAYGLPALLIPALPEHVRQSELLAAAGAAIVLRREEADPGETRRRVSELLANPAYRDAASGLAAQIRAQPSPACIVGWLEEIAAARGPSRRARPAVNMGSTHAS